MEALESTESLPPSSLTDGRSTARRVAEVMLSDLDLCQPEDGAALDSWCTTLSSCEGGCG